MKNDSLVIMAGGASSRMKRSLAHANLDSTVLEAAQKFHKSLIPLDEKGRPLLYFLIRNAFEAEIRNIYIITSENNSAFYEFLKTFEEDKMLQELSVRFAIQHVPENRDKPLGTADAVEQCMDQYTELQEQRFTVCNGDNLYSSKVMKLLKQNRITPHATIAYKGSGLGFDDQRLSKFAVMDIDESGHLLQIIEKPEVQEMNAYRDESDELAISMNIFNFSGDKFYSHVKNCPINPSRGEKELPEAVRMAVTEYQKALFCYKVSEFLPDLTTAEDIKKMNLYL